MKIPGIARTIPVVVAVLVFHALSAPPARADAVRTAGERSAAWLVARQNGDGGFGNGFGPGSDVGATADAVMGLGAAGRSVKDLRSKLGRSPFDYLAAKVRAGGLSTGQWAKVALGLLSAGQDPRHFGGQDIVARVLAGYDARTAIFGDSAFAHALALLALARASAPLPIEAVSALESLQSPAGGWAFSGSGAPDVDTTAVAVQALIAAGRPANSGPAGRGLGYLHGLQNADGGFPYESPSKYGTESNANSTALVVQALIAAGDQPESWAAPNGNPLSALVAAQLPSGALSYQRSYPSDSILATAGALPALYRAPLGK